MATSIVFHENKKGNLVLQVKDKLCAMTLEVKEGELKMKLKTSQSYLFCK